MYTAQRTISRKFRRCRLRFPLGDLISGLRGAMTVMVVARYHRDVRRGEGQIIDLALYEAVSVPFRKCT